ncbi:hypothetical protein TNCV_1994741 [Trichonephila clavipes]|nr:hypothetical protein TNCV_1994741 [Trichonephila clavipes]
MDLNPEGNNTEEFCSKENPDEILKLKHALKECKKIHVSENYEVIADNTCDSEKFKEKASVIDSHTQHDSSSVYVTEKEICLIILIANYLRIHPMGCTTYELGSFLSHTYPDMIYKRDGNSVKEIS